MKRGKEAIVNKYIWEKIEQNKGMVDTDKVAEIFDISRKTVYEYLRKSINRGELRYIRRGTYQFITNKVVDEYIDIEKGKSDEMIIYDKWIKKHLEDFPQNVRDIWIYACTEMLNNVIDHSDSKDVHIMVEKNIWNTRILISDVGIGIFRKIKEFFDFDSETEAMQELFKGKLTTDSENHSGEGIFFTSRVMDEFLVVSGSEVFKHNNFEDYYLRKNEWENDKSTIVIMNLSNHSGRQIADIFNEHSDDEGRFLRMSLTLRNIFANNNPVSRSQAKRLVRRFEEYEEIMLDFEGVENIGQGFVHELFIVFKQKQPHIKIDVLNPSENVKKMITHVTQR